MADFPNTLDRSGGFGVASGYVTSGNVTVGAHATWADSGLGVNIPASAGQKVAVQFTVLIEWASLFSDYFDVAVIDGGPSIVRRLSTGTSSATTADKGDVSLYGNPGGFVRSSSPFAFTVAAGDLVSGNVQFRFISRGSGGSTLYASTDFPMRYYATVS